jgi:hypothetical protein
VNEDNIASHKKRMQLNPEHVKALANNRTKKHYFSNIEKSREVSRKSAAKAREDPVKRERINMRKRAGGIGFTVEEFKGMLDKQGKKCYICKSDNPGSKSGWNIDHCHRINKVRFILCAHCNRGLGAFKDSSSIMRAAADAIDEFYSNEPVSAIKS